VSQYIVTVTVSFLFAWALALAGSTLWLRLWSRRQQKLRLTIEAAWQPQVQRFALDAAPLARPHGRERQVVLNLLLRYAAVLRGAEVERIAAYLEREGFVAEALAELRSRRRWRRARAADLLGRMHSARSVDPLISALHDPSPDVRAVAARSLAASGDQRAVVALSAVLVDESQWAASAVVAYLLGMGAEVVPILSEIVARANDGDQDARQTAITAVRVLGETRDPQATPILLDLLARSADLDLRARAAAALGAIGDPQTLPALLPALRDPAWQVRAQAARSLGLLGSSRAVFALQSAIFDESWWVRRNCAEALNRLGTAGQRALQSLSLSDDRYVRERVAAVLEPLARAQAQAQPETALQPQPQSQSQSASQSQSRPSVAT
jgi:HEAT repeat protein